MNYKLVAKVLLNDYITQTSEEDVERFIENIPNEKEQKAVASFYEKLSRKKRLADEEIYDSDSELELGIQIKTVNELDEIEELLSHKSSKQSSLTASSPDISSESDEQKEDEGSVTSTRTLTMDELLYLLTCILATSCSLHKN